MSFLGPIEGSDLMSLDEVIAALDIRGSYHKRKLRQVFEEAEMRFTTPPPFMKRICGDWYVRKTDLPRVRAAFDYAVQSMFRVERFSRR